MLDTQFFILLQILTEIPYFKKWIFYCNKKQFRDTAGNWSFSSTDWGASWDQYYSEPQTPPLFSSVAKQGGGLWFPKFGPDLKKISAPSAPKTSFLSVSAKVMSFCFFRYFFILKICIYFFISGSIFFYQDCIFERFDIASGKL